MTLVEFNGRQVESYSQFRHLAEKAGGRINKVMFENEESGETVTATVQPALQYSSDHKQVHFMGLIPAVRVAEAQDKKPAAYAGVLSGDLIAQIGSMRWPTRPQIFEVIGAAAKEKKPVSMTVLRDGEEVEIGEIVPKDGVIGIVMDLTTNVIASTLPDSEVADLNLAGGSRILAVNGVDVANFTQAMLEVGKAIDKREQSVSITLENAVKGSSPQTFDMALNDERIESVRDAGLATPFNFKMLQLEVQTNKPLQAAALGIRKTRQTMTQVYLTLMRLIQTRVSVKEMRGPVGIAEIGTVIARDHGPSYFFFFLGLISVNLAVINFLPVPVVDGGHMVFLMLEKIKGSPVSVKIQAAATYAGFALILTVFVFTFYNDAMRLITGS
jgi:regulator of sigma E protease